MEILKIGSTGPLVELVQSILKNLGIYTGEIDGIFGNRTQTAVRTFQSRYGLSSDGVVGEITWSALNPYIYGFLVYTIRLGDTIYSIAERYRITVNQIKTANPNINENNLQVGTSIIVPFETVVNTDISYSYSILDMNIRGLKTIYPFLEIGSIGQSVLGNNLRFIKIGNGSKQVFYNASFHANEWITTPVLMKFIEDYSKAYVNNQNIFGYNARSLYQNVSLYIVPMVNPDGVNLVTGEIKENSSVYNSVKEIADNYPTISFPSGWKANIRGVDLNLQFPAGWEQAREIKYEQGFTSPAPRDFVGDGPLVAPEALAVYNFTLANNFRLVLAYHTQGRVIYWQFQDYLPPASYFIAERFSEVSGYEIADVPYQSSFAGYKDWFIQTYNRPGYTIESGIGINPLPISQFNSIYSDNIGILILGMIL